MRANRYWSLRRALKYSAPLIQLCERPRIRRYGEQDTKTPPVFILGLPRSGSTFVYQVLTDLYDVLYVDNLMTLGRECLYFSGWLSHRLFKDRPHNSYDSEYGRTWESGLHAPSEAGPLWYRWIPKEAVYLDEESLDRQQRKAFTRNIHALINRYRKPLVIKNLYFSTRIRLIRSLFPAAKFILVERDPLYVAQSIYLARIKNMKDPENEWWSVGFPDYQELLGRPVEEQVAAQVTELEAIIERDLSDVDPLQVLRLSYASLQEDLDTKPVDRFLGAERRVGSSSDHVDYRVSDTQKVNDEVFGRLNNALENSRKAYQN